MKKFTIIVALVASFATMAGAQKMETNKLRRFSSINLAGVGSGENGESVAVQTINGISTGKWFGGIGLGVDYYALRTVPVFADLRYELVPETNALFVYANAGVNLPWLNDNQKNQRTVNKPGLTYEGGLGWKLKGKHNRSFLLSCGYNFKQVKQVATVFNWILPAGNEQKEYIDSRYRRLIIKLGFQL